MANVSLTFPDGSRRAFPAGTTGRDVARSISEGLARNALAIRIGGAVRDLDRVIDAETDADAHVAILTWNDDDGKATFWHSTAHLMAEALDALYPGVRFGIGPAIEQGFYYDVDLGETEGGARKLGAEDLAAIEGKMSELARRDVPFERREVPKDEALAYFLAKDDPYKLELLDGLADGTISFYTQGGFTDLCRGPHIPSTGAIKAVKLTSIAGAYWRGDSSRPQLTRLYGISFPKKSELDAWVRLREEAERRDHRKLGRELELFMLDPMIGQGLPVWLPKGTVLRRTLESFLRDEQRRRGYDEVITPHIGSIELYKTSGHYPYYADSQYPPMTLEDGDAYLLKPMNCPHHHRVYASKPRSYRDLPVRLAEFGTVYRFEQSGELGGLARVRGFTQDDAHLYCTDDQLKAEIRGVVELTQFVFRTFGMEVTTRLSFRDDNDAKYGGDAALWDRAQREIQDVADEMGFEYFVGEGEASFYGPKIDFIVRDALGRKWQLGTVQVDYVMPERFALDYTGADGQKHRPVILHRAPFGSMERFVSILIEHFAGDFPLWIAPVQIAVLPVSNAFDDYARRVEQTLRDADLRADADLRHEKVGYKIRQAELQKVPIMLVIGASEAEAGTVTVRRHGAGDATGAQQKATQETLALDAFVAATRAEIAAQMGRG